MADKPAVPFRVPPGIKLIRIDPKSGMRIAGSPGELLEAFKPGTAPPDSYSIIGYQDGEAHPASVSPDADGVVPTARGLCQAVEGGGAVLTLKVKTMRSFLPSTNARYSDMAPRPKTFAVRDKTGCAVART